MNKCSKMHDSFVKERIELKDEIVKIKGVTHYVPRHSLEVVATDAPKLVWNVNMVYRDDVLQAAFVVTRSALSVDKLNEDRLSTGMSGITDGVVTDEKFSLVRNTNRVRVAMLDGLPMSKENVLEMCVPLHGEVSANTSDPTNPVVHTRGIITEVNPMRGDFDLLGVLTDGGDDGLWSSIHIYGYNSNNVGRLIYVEVVPELTASCVNPIWLDVTYAFRHGGKTEAEFANGFKFYQCNGNMNKTGVGLDQGKILMAIQNDEIDALIQTYNSMDDKHFYVEAELSYHYKFGMNSNLTRLNDAIITWSTERTPELEEDVKDKFKEILSIKSQILRFASIFLNTRLDGREENRAENYLEFNAEGRSSFREAFITFYNLGIYDADINATVSQLYMDMANVVNEQQEVKNKYGSQFEIDGFIYGNDPANPTPKVYFYLPQLNVGPLVSAITDGAAIINDASNHTNEAVAAAYSEMQYLFYTAMRPANEIAISEANDGVIGDRNPERVVAINDAIDQYFGLVDTFNGLGIDEAPTVEGTSYTKLVNSMQANILFYQNQIA